MTGIRSSLRPEDVITRYSSILIGVFHTPSAYFCKSRLGFGQPPLLRGRQPVFLFQLMQHRHNDGETSGRIIAMRGKIPV